MFIVGVIVFGGHNAMGVHGAHGTGTLSLKFQFSLIYLIAVFSSPSSFAYPALRPPHTAPDHFNADREPETGSLGRE
jgi:hypothetical protein